MKKIIISYSKDSRGQAPPGLFNSVAAVYGHPAYLTSMQSTS